MMKILVSAIVLGIAALIGFTTKTTTNKKAVVQPPHTFYYYPKANMYYDATAGNYFYLSNDGKSWQQTNQLNASQQAALGKNVVLPHSSAPVWKNNAEHRLVYSAALYATPSDLTTKIPAGEKTAYTKEKGSSHKAAVRRNVVHKSKVARFFNKLFGKKRKYERDY